MEENLEVKFIVHCEFDKDETFLEQLDTNQRIDGKVIIFTFDSKRFNEFNYYHPSILVLANTSRTK